MRCKRSLNIGQTTRPSDSQQKKKKNTFRFMDFSVSIDHRVIMKESENRDKYLDLTRELKKKTLEHEGDSDTNCKWCS